MVSTLEQMQVPNVTGPGVHRSKRPLLHPSNTLPEVTGPYLSKYPVSLWMFHSLTPEQIHRECSGSTSSLLRQKVCVHCRKASSDRGATFLKHYMDRINLINEDLIICVLVFRQDVFMKHIYSYPL